MRILHLLASPFWQGPAERVALLALAQRELGHEVRVAVDRKRAVAAPEGAIAPRLQALGLLDEGGLELSVKSLPWAVARDAARLRRRELDVVHSHQTHDHFVAVLGRPAGARLVRSIHAPRSLRWSVLPADAFTVPGPELLEELRWRHHQRGIILPPLVGSEPGPAAASNADVARAVLELYGAPR